MANLTNQIPVIQVHNQTSIEIKIKGTSLNNCLHCRCFEQNFERRRKAWYDYIILLKVNNFHNLSQFSNGKFTPSSRGEQDETWNLFSRNSMLRYFKQSGWFFGGTIFSSVVFGVSVITWLEHFVSWFRGLRYTCATMTALDVDKGGCRTNYSPRAYKKSGKALN